MHHGENETFSNSLCCSRIFASHAEGDQRYDLILDIGREFVVDTPQARPRHNWRRDRWTVAGGGTDRQIRALALSPFVGQKLGTFVNRENHEDLMVLKELIESGQITPVIDRNYPLAEVPEAMRYLEEEHARGKAVITV